MNLSTSSLSTRRQSAEAPISPAPLLPNTSAYPWLFSPRTDLTVFLGSAIVSMIALAIGARAGVLHDDSPDWAWIPAVDSHRFVAKLRTPVSYCHTLRYAKRK